MNNKFGTVLVWSIALLVVAVGVYFLKFYQPPTVAGRGFGERAASVKLHTVENYRFADIIESVGTAKANESVVLTARVSETVQSVNFEDGQKVEADQIIVELTNGEEIAGLNEAKANLREARRQYDRFKDLVTQGNSSQAVLDARTRELEAAQSRLAAAEARLADRQIRTPFAGVLGIRQVSKGALVSPGVAITTLDDVSIIKADFSIPEGFLSILKEGQVINTRSAAYPGETFKGIVKTVASRVDAATRTVQVRAEIHNQDGRLRPGMLLVVNLVSNERQMPAVPEVAIVPVSQTQYVYVAGPDMTAERVAITTGVQSGDMVEVLSGLEVGQRIVSSGIIRVRPGIKLKDLDADNPRAQAQADQ